MAVAVSAAVNALLVEADPDGGVLGLRFGAWLNQGAPSLATLLAAVRPGAPVDVDAHSQRLPSGIDAVLLPAVAEDAVGPVAHLVAALPALRAVVPGGRLVLDVGRVRPGSAAMGLAAGSDVCVLVARADVEGLACLLMRLPALAVQLPALVVAVRGDGPYRPDDVRAELTRAAGRPVPVVFVRDDPRGVAGLAQPNRKRSGRPSALMQAADELAAAATSVNSRASLHSTASSTGVQGSRPSPDAPGGPQRALHEVTPAARPAAWAPAAGPPRPGGGAW